MKILVYGIGAMGSIYASLLSRSSNEVFVVDPWKEHISEIKKNGLKIEGASGNYTYKNINASFSIPKKIKFDLIIIATKASGVKKAAQDIKEFTNNKTIIISIQNGIGSTDDLKLYIPKNNIIIGVADGFGASIVKPGYIHHNAMKLIRLGELDSKVTERLNLICDLWSKAGFNVLAYDNINQLIWEKFICNVTFSAPCTVYECSVGEIINNNDYWKVASGCALEAFEIATKKNIPLSFDAPIEYVRNFGLKMPKAKPSMYLDHLSKRKSEIDFINGRVEIMGEKLNIKTPYNFILSSIIRQKELVF